MDRYLILHKVGMGGMGVVYAAYDPQLDRKIALKVLLPGLGGGKGRLRLLREAQALGRLSHPNVVTVHDVGTVDDQVWLAMEFLQGETLSQWLKEPRGWPQALDVLRGAGEGLAAAHSAGLLHRDFKPENVMVCDDGRVCVMDFGLAREDDREGDGDDADDSETARGGPPPDKVLANAVTDGDALVGTPTYMAPEQWSQDELTAAADQFAFCVTLWQALYGQRPFEGETLHEIMANVIEGNLRSPPSAHSVPRWLRRVCERGLNPQSMQRWPSMRTLLDALARGRTRAAARKGVAIAGVLLLLVGGLEARRRLDLAERTAACDAAGAEIEAVWSEERAQELRDALVATGQSTATTTADKVMPWLDRQAEQWRDARVEACLDSDLRGRWDAAMLERSLWCLDERRLELESLVDELATADEDVLRNAVLAASELAQVAPCRDERVLQRLTPPPSQTRESLRRVRADLLRASNLRRVGRYDEGLALARDALARAEALQWPPLVAAARVELGGGLESTGRYAEAEEEFERAYFDAAKGVAPETAFDAAWELVYVVGTRRGRSADGQRWARLADIALEDVFDGEGLRRAALLQVIAGVHITAREYEEARAPIERVLEIWERVLGPEHPRVASGLHNLAIVHAEGGEAERAREILERALAIRQQTLGPEHPTVASSINNLAFIHEKMGEDEQAVARYEQALSIRRKVLGLGHRKVAESHQGLASVLQRQGNLDQAKVHYEQALAISEDAIGPEHPLIALLLLRLANLALEQDRAGDALPLARRALALRRKGEVSAELLAEAHYVVARALWDAPLDLRDRGQARLLAEQARDALRSTGQGSSESLDEVETWLAEHGE